MVGRNLTDEDGEVRALTSKDFKAARPIADVDPGMADAMTAMRNKGLEAAIRRLTQPVNGQYPRPWMTSMTHPEKARVFIVGYNQATGFPAALVESHDEYIDALFNRNGRSCRKLYDRLRGDDGPSPTRKNIDMLREKLARESVVDVMETNVICYSTPMSCDLTLREHQGGKRIGRQIFEEILGIVRPDVLIAHGARTAKELGRVLHTQLPPAAAGKADDVACVRIRTELRGIPYAPVGFVIPSLAPPSWNVWQNWAEPHLAEICTRVRDVFAGHRRNTSA